MSNQINHQSFRKDINGLRALAVLPVLMFHAKVNWMQGGYLGVDVFFVISGYLITNQIFELISINQFSFTDFYIRRARRLLPVYIFIATLTSLLSIFFMLPYDLKNYGQSLVASSLASNNILLYLTSGYWSTSAEFKPLYHTWSLAVEEQFYLFIPLFLFMMRKKASLLFTLVILFSLSLFYFLTTKDLELQFLSLHTRAWQLLSGVILSLILNGKNKISGNNFLSFLGLTIIVITYFLPIDHSINRNYLNILVTFGTILVITYSNQNTTIVGKFLSLRCFFHLGILSYGIYLWHQPLLAFLRLHLPSEPHVAFTVFLSFLSIPLAYVTYNLIEKPARDKHIISNKNIIQILFLSIAILVCLGYVLHRTYGLKSLNPQFDYGLNPQEYVDKPKIYSEDLRNHDQGLNILFIGNSFARDLINVFIESNQLDKNNISYRNNECTTTLPKELIPPIKANSTIIISQDWGYSDEIDKDITSIKHCIINIQNVNPNARIIIFGTKNFGWNNNFIKWKSDADLLNYKVSALSKIIDFDQAAKLQIPNYFSLLDFFSNGRMMPITDQNGKFISYDSRHLTEFGAQYIGKIIMPSFIVFINGEN